MKIITKAEITDGTIVIPKGTTGNVVAIQWGDKNLYVVDFPNNSGVYVKKQDATVLEEKYESQKSRSEEEKVKRNQ